MRLRYSLFASAFALTAPLLACSSTAIPAGDVPTEGTIGSSDEALADTPSKVWTSPFVDDREIIVCWNFDGFDTAKSWVRSAVEKQWPVVADVRIVG